MDVIAPFGFVTACHAGDKFMVQATLASMKYYCSGVPICLLADGDVDVSDLQRDYGVIVMRPRDLSDARMTALVSGNYRIKLAAMWEGPFEFYVWVDSDAIVWGDFTAQVRRDADFQIFWSEVSVEPDAVEVPVWLPHFYFDLERLRQHDPEFEWRGWPYFSAGVYACRRGFISFEEWMTYEEWNSQHAGGLFRFGDQGILNYVVHSRHQRGERKVAVSDLQYHVEHHGRREIDEDTANCGWSFPNAVARPRVCHFCGKKPLLSDPRAYSRAFTIARLEHYRLRRANLGAWFAILREEAGVVTGKARRRMSRFINKHGKAPAASA
jgi:hypothetical protein